MSDETIQVAGTLMPPTRNVDEYRMSVVCDMFLSGSSPKEIAARFSVTADTIRRWQRSPEFMEEMDSRTTWIRENTLQRHRAVLGKAFDTMEELLGSSDPKTRFQAAKYLLDRVPLEEDDVYARGVKDGAAIQVDIVDLSAELREAKEQGMIGPGAAYGDED